LLKDRKQTNRQTNNEENITFLGGGNKEINAVKQYLPLPAAEIIILTSCGGTSNETVLKSTFV